MSTNMELKNNQLLGSDRERQKKRFRAGPCLPLLVKHGTAATIVLNSSPSTVRMKLFLMSILSDLWETLHVNSFPESLREALR